MTTVQTMLAVVRTLVLCASVLAGSLLVGGCANKSDRLDPPHTLVSPYDSVGGDVVFGVAPLLNEAGTTTTQSLRVTDALVNKITEAEGLAAVPTDRVLGAMESLGLHGVTSPDEAMQLARTLGVDGLIIGAVTAYDPYDPPKLGLSLTLFITERRTPSTVDPAELRAAYSGDDIPLTVTGQGPGASVSMFLDGASHAVQMRVERYATGRHDYDSALGWRRFLASMELYTDFAAWTALERLLDAERLRLTRMVAAQPAG